jgi:type IV pilus assembly protein PilA
MMKKAQQGFTLIELMIVVAIIGILAAIAIPQYQTYIAKSQVTRVMGEVGGVKTAIDLCLVDGKTAFGSQAGQCDPGATPSNIQSGAGQNTNYPPNSATASTLTTTGAPVSSALGTFPLTIVATFANNASADLKVGGQNTLTWTRTVDGTWTCTTTALAKYRPAGCQ